MYLKAKYKDIQVSYLWRLNGGGIIFAHEYVRQVTQKIGKVGHVFEFCAGPGYIGFALLANGLCDRLTLADVNPEAIAAVQDTIKNNYLQDKVTVYQSDCLDVIPKSEQWDLVVGNPPWWLCQEERKNIRVCDPKGIVHEKFFRDIAAYLKPKASILLVEGGEYTNPAHFQDMIEKNGLKMISFFDAVPVKDFFKGWSEYKGLKLGYIGFLRLCLTVREVYFIKVGTAPTFCCTGVAKKVGAVPTFSKGQLLQIIRKQKALLWVYLGMIISYVFIFTPLGTMPVFIFWLWAMFLVLHLAMAMEKKRSEIYFFAMLIPIIKLIIPVILLIEVQRKLNPQINKSL